LALAVPLSRFTSRVGGGSAFYVRQHESFRILPSRFRGGDFGGSVLLPVWTVQFRQAGIEFYAISFSRLTPLGWFGSSRKSGGWF
jgi:hypothetical protein